MIKHWLTALGLVFIIVGIVMLIVIKPDPNVPNDPNIGAGVVFVLGLATTVGGIIYARGVTSRR